MAAPSRLTKNTSYLTMAYIIQKMLTLVYFVIVARVYGPVGQGQYSASLALAALFAVLTDLGLSFVLTREVARKPERASALLSQALLFRMLMGILIFAVTMLFVWGRGYSDQMILLVALAGIATWFDMISTPCWAVFRGLQRLQYESTSVLMVTAIMVGMGSTVALLHGPLYLLIVGILISSVVSCFYAFMLLRRKAQVFVKLKFDRSLMGQILIWAAPFAVAAIASRIYTYVDAVMLQRIAGDAHAGWYSAANKIVLALQFIPAALAAAVYATMSAQFENDTRLVGRTYSLATYYLMLLVIPMGMGLATLAPYFISVVGGQEYTQSIPVLQVLSIALVSSFLIFPLGSLLAAINKQKQNSIILTIAGLINVGINIFLIPRWQEVGAAWASSITYTFILIASLVLTWQLWKDYKKYLIVSFLKMTTAATIMAGAIIVIQQTLSTSIAVLLNTAHIPPTGVIHAIINALLYVFIGAIVYGGVLLLLRGITIKQIRDGIHAIIKKDEPHYEESPSRNA